MEPLCNPSAGERGALSLDFRPRQQESLKQETFAVILLLLHRGYTAATLDGI